MKTNMCVLSVLFSALFAGPLYAEAYSEDVAEVIDEWVGKKVEVVGWVGSATLVKCNRETGFCLAKSHFGGYRWILHYTRVKLVIQNNDELPKF